MSKIKIDNANKILLAITSEIINDDYLFKLLYYINESQYENVDIYSLPIPDEIDRSDYLINNKLLRINKRLDKISTYADVGIFVNLYSVLPCMADYRTSKYVKSYCFQIGIVCHNEVRNILNGYREVAIIERMLNIFENKSYLGGIGTFNLDSVYPAFDVPNDYVAYSLKIDAKVPVGIKDFE